jgi:hypothetical protein
MQQFPQRPSPEVVSLTRSQQLDKRLLAYTLAGAGAVALAPSAAAEIIYTPADIRLTSGILHIDLNHDGINDFGLHNYEFYDSSHTAYPHGNLNVVADANPRVGVLGQRPLALSSGVPIGPSQHFFHLQARGRNLAFAFCYPLRFPLDCNSGGLWKNVTDRYLGIGFDIDGKIHYGWARLTVRINPRKVLPLIKARVTGYAYETEPNKTINAGDTGANASIGTGHPANVSLKADHTQRSSSLGLLSLGAIGLDAWRKQKQNSTTTSGTP